MKQLLARVSTWNLLSYRHNQFDDD